MKRILLLAAIPLLAQDAPPADTTAAGPEPPVEFSAEVGYRWLGSIGGNNEVYRSVVNLGEGPRLLNFGAALNTSNRWMDEFSFEGSGWGDPYNHFLFRAGKQKLYRISGDYRNVAYFSALPSFANPTVDQGLYRSQRTFDMTRRYADVLLELRPATRVIPYFQYTRDSGDGRGVTLFVPSQNEYPVASDLDDSTDTLRGGVRLEASRLHVTLEMGGYRFRDDQRVFTSDPNPGNRTTLFLGQQLFLDRLEQNYDVRGDALFTRGYLTASPMSWLDVHGAFLYSQPEIDTDYRETATGRFAQGVPPIFSAEQNALFAATAKQPHTRGSFGFEMRPLSRLRVIQSFTTDRLRTSSAAIGVSDSLRVNNSQQQIDALFDIGKGWTFRAGHRYSFGNSQTRAPRLSPTAAFLESELDRQAGLWGVQYRASERLSAGIDGEHGRGDSALFRTSLLNYDRLRARARLQLSTTISVSYRGSLLSNDNPHARTAPNLDDYDALFVENAAAIMWTPTALNEFRVTGEYARQSFRTDTLYLQPSTFTPERSRYREDAHSASFGMDTPLRMGAVRPRLTVGGSLFRSSGSRPTMYAQPTARVVVPVARRMSWAAEWRWWSMSEPYYRFEQFRNHQATISVLLQ